jgi:hypothetical protein
MTQLNTIHIEISCIDCQKTLGFYEVADREPLIAFPHATQFYCLECLDKKEEKTEELR